MIIIQIRLKEQLQIILRTKCIRIQGWIAAEDTEDLKKVCDKVLKELL